MSQVYRLENMGWAVQHVGISYQYGPVTVYVRALSLNSLQHILSNIDLYTLYIYIYIVSFIQFCFLPSLFVSQWGV